MEQLPVLEHKNAAELFSELSELEPKLVEHFVPADGPEQKRGFLAGEIVNPNHSYARLGAVDFSGRLQQIDTVGEQILSDPGLSPKHRPAYEGSITNLQQRTRLMQLAHAYKHTDDPEARANIKESFMDLNTEFYGAPDVTTYRSLLTEKVAKANAKPLVGTAARVRDELQQMTSYTPGAEVPERFKPSDDTIAWMHGVATELYGGMLSHVPEQETFTATELADVFRNVLTSEFAESADGWTVDVEPATSVNVRPLEKRIVIPEDRADMSHDAVRGLVVHELGVHVQRAISGSETDLPVLVKGLSNYQDAEEGLGVVMEQAMRGEFVESGVDHYITAGAVHHDGMDFRKAYELKWRLKVLEKADGDVSDDQIAKAQDAAYKGVMRMLRGTDELPWFKDLSYYNGAVSQWKHLESIKGDDLKFMFMLMGKADAANIEHERILYETKTA